MPSLRLLPPTGTPASTSYCIQYTLFWHLLELNPPIDGTAAACRALLIRSKSSVAQQQRTCTHRDPSIHGIETINQSIYLSIKKSAANDQLVNAVCIHQKYTLCLLKCSCPLSDSPPYQSASLPAYLLFSPLHPPNPFQDPLKSSPVPYTVQGKPP